MKPRHLLAAVALISALPAAARPQAAAPATPAANPRDVESVDAIITALYDVISGPAGQRRDWDRMRSLFAPGASLIPTGRRPDGSYGSLTWDVEQYISTAGGRLESEGFFEREVARRSESFNGITHAFSTYESRHTAGDPAPFVRGINSIQLRYDGTRWWVLNIAWASERPDAPIPARYLTSGDGQ